MVQRVVSPLCALLTVLPAIGCTADIADDTGPLTDACEWTEVGPSDDPYDDRPEGASCGPYAWAVEEGVLEVETDDCDYVTLKQGLLRGVRAGETIIVDVWHLGLWADPPTQGHVSVGLAADRWEARPEIPSPSARWQATFEVERPLPAKTAIYLHVHNHGANAWRFGPPTSR